MVIRAARDPKSKEVIIHRQQTIESVRDTITRIQQEADPIGFLVAVQNGAMIEIIQLSRNEDGEMIQRIHYEQPTIKQRIEVAKLLAQKVLPSVSVQKVVVEDLRPKDKPEDTHYVPGQEGQPTFAQLVHAAASKASLAPRVTVVEPPPVTPGGAMVGSAGEDPYVEDAEYADADDLTD